MYSFMEHMNVMKEVCPIFIWTYHTESDGGGPVTLKREVAQKHKRSHQVKYVKDPGGGWCNWLPSAVPGQIPLPLFTI